MDYSKKHLAELRERAERLRVVRLSTGPISGSERMGILAAGYIELRDHPDPDLGDLAGGPFRIVEVGPDWIDVVRP